MKVKVLCRNPDDYLRETKKDLHKVPRNFDPALHPLQEQREYVRALNATKLERVFAKPFIGNLEGHNDGVTCFAKHPSLLVSMASGAYDGGICIWDLPMRQCTRRFDAHNGWVRAMCYNTDGSKFFSVGDDKTIKTWASYRDESEEDPDEALSIIMSKTMLTGITHHKSEPIFATCGETCYLWEETRSTPLQEMSFQIDTLHDIKFNQIHTYLIGACGSDRSIIMYDKRVAKPIKKVIMTLRPNRMSWSPKDGHAFAVANEDYNAYSFDYRYLKKPYKIHKGHVQAVLDVDWAPTGEELVTGSYDKTIRIFNAHQSSAREIYHTKRMQHITSIGWSMDGKYIYSGSDEMNIRLWKANASEKLGALRPREKFAFSYNEAIKERFAAHPQIRRIARHRQLPKYVYNEAKNLRLQINKLKRKENNRRINSKPGLVPFVPELTTKVIKQEEPKKKKNKF
uniref:DDB1- and CUL4-associated factor 13 n=1 Tax=Culicoides sonorensis TaxID=179676 RepID=A0A336LJS7_CULSO